MTKVLVFAGPSGGHLYPALAFSEACYQKIESCQVSLVTTPRGKRIISTFPSESFHKYHYLHEFPHKSGNLPARFTFLLKLLLAFFKSAILIIQEKPSVCVGFGSFVSFPGLWLAAKMKVPTVIHEQNVYPGKATEWLHKSVDHVAITFEETRKSLSASAMTTTGLPVRRELRDAVLKNRQTQKKGNGKLSLLIFGGSQGATNINRVVMEALGRLSLEDRSHLVVNHIVGKSALDEMKRRYETLGITHQVFDFFNPMHDLYQEADMAITRAGANSLFELALFEIPAVAIPYPFAGAHQTANLKCFESYPFIEACEETQFTPDWLAEKLHNSIEKNLQGHSFSHPSSSRVALDAADRLVEIMQENVQEVL